nr:element excision factor XisI family protein [Scytonema hofmannii]
MSVGWNKNNRVYRPIMHLDIKNEKIWIQQNTATAAGTIICELTICNKLSKPPLVKKLEEMCL